MLPVAASVQLPELPNEPVVGEAVKLTAAVGVLAPLDAVSVTVAVQVVALPVATDEGEQPTLVDVGSSGGAEIDAVKVYGVIGSRTVPVSRLRQSLPLGFWQTARMQRAVVGACNVP